MENKTSEHNNEPEIPVRKPGLRAHLFKPAGIAALTLSVAACICLVIAMFVSSDPETTAAQIQPPQTVAQQNKSAPRDALDPYEEPMENDLNDLVKIVDLTFINTLKETKVSMSDLKLEDVSLKKYQGRDFHFQQLSFPYTGDPKAFVTKIKDKLAKTDLNATINEAADGKWLVSINGIPTHNFSIITPKPKKEPQPAKTDPNAPRMAIVIDDMGEDLALAKALGALDVKVTFSIWPSSSYVKRTMEIARKYGNEILIHLPMQPKGYPKVNPGPNALMVGMTAEQIHKIVDAAADRVPGARGLNNHMGSLFTENYSGMRAVMTQLKKRKIFFLDSRTTPKSAGPRAALDSGVTVYERDIFLDNVKDVAAIKYQLSKTARIAQKRGQAIAIGHPNWETLKAIKEWAKENRGKINLVPVESLVPKKRKR